MKPQTKSRKLEELDALIEGLELSKLEMERALERMERHIEERYRIRRMIANDDLVAPISQATRPRRK